MISIDQVGRTIELPSLPKRIISLVPSQTELLAALGLEDEVVGITKFCVHPESWFKSKIRVGGTKQVNVELIRSLQPDLIIANKEENTKEICDILSTIAPVWISDIGELNGALQMIQELSKVTGREEQGVEIVERIVANFKSMDQFVPIQEKSSVKYFIWSNPSMLAGKKTFIDDMLTRSGFVNCADAERYPEDDGRIEPDLIFLSSEPFPFSEKHIEEYKKVYPNSLYFIVDGEYFSWYGARLMDAPAYFLKLRSEISECISRQKGN
jgi:ABC-type Fe3+-hydroxamate transport system substrate-binding protein